MSAINGLDCNCQFVHHFRNERGTGAETRPQLFLGSLLGTRRSAIGQFFSLSQATVPEVFAKVNSAHFPRFYCGECNSVFIVFR